VPIICGDCSKTYEVRVGQKRNNRRCFSCASERQARISVLHRMVRRAVKAGTITKSDCEICGSKRTYAHHDDYAEPLKVRWLCGPHHHQHHVKHGPGKNA
jgi:hypothetical protein